MLYMAISTCPPTVPLAARCPCPCVWRVITAHFNTVVERVEEVVQFPRVCVHFSDEAEMSHTLGPIPDCMLLYGILRLDAPLDFKVDHMLTDSHCAV